MCRPAETQFPQVGVVPFRVVERNSGPFSAHACSPFAPHRAPMTGRLQKTLLRPGTVGTSADVPSAARADVPGGYLGGRRAIP